MYQQWTTKQEQIVREFASLGVDFIVEEIKRETGISRTRQGVKQHASLMGVSLAKFETCPRCGRRQRKLKRRTGLCDLCNVKELRDGELRRNAELEKLRRELSSDVSESNEYKAVWREYKAIARKNQRMAKRL